MLTTNSNYHPTSIKKYHPHCGSQITQHTHRPISLIASSKPITPTHTHKNHTHTCKHSTAFIYEVTYNRHIMNHNLNALRVASVLVDDGGSLLHITAPLQLPPTFDTNNPAQVVQTCTLLPLLCLTQTLETRARAMSGTARTLQCFTVESRVENTAKDDTHAARALSAA